ncbi:MAG TPA: DUF3108 domain-containing protein [Usitatibacter sp.]|jgi:hypothetical protein|nr:DUF3108 domain-containing protein [Usitatibacter sp.]
MKRLSRRHRVLLLALAASAALHAAVVIGLPGTLGADAADGAGTPAPAYIATLAPPPRDPDDLPKPAPPPGPRKPAPHRAAHRAPPRPHVLVPPPPEPIVAQAEPLRVPAPLERIADTQALAALETFAPLAEPVPDLAAVEPDTFPVDALPDDLEIDYALTSAVADAHAVYRWQREGDHYRITGEGAADGFFSLFLEGRMVQESEGTVTPSGLRPARFIERKPDTQDEGLEFDWSAHQVTFELGEKKKTGKLADNSVDWLSMIFQLAHVPPPEGVHEMKISVLTQRKQYHFGLQAIGLEDIVIPLGHVRALHLRHVDTENPKEVVDVWLGLDQHYLPVKLRYPVAHNRLTVEQSATRLTSR